MHGNIWNIPKIPLHKYRQNIVQVEGLSHKGSFKWSKTSSVQLTGSISPWYPYLRIKPRQIFRLACYVVIADNPTTMKEGWQKQVSDVAETEQAYSSVPLFAAAGDTLEQARINTTAPLKLAWKTTSKKCCTSSQTNKKIYNNYKKDIVRTDLVKDFVCGTPIMLTLWCICDDRVT